jgi:uncharacterized membrane protein
MVLNPLPFFSTLQPMTEHEIQAVQKELDELKQQFTLQQRKIAELQRRLDEASGKPVASPSSAGPKIQWSLENFIGLRLIHFVGIVVLVIGLSIGVKYAIDRDLISENLRIVLAYTAGVVLYALAMRLRKKYNLFSAILFSGAMASLYFTTYAASVYYNLLSFVPAFGIMIALTAYTTYEALRYNRQEIGLLGLIGAYGIPFLISRNADNPALLFLYISVINSGVAFLCIKKSWKSIGVAAQCITWLLFLGWAALRFEIAFQWVGLAFMCFFFFLFSFVIISFKLVHKQKLEKNDTYLLLFNNVALYAGSLFIFNPSFASEGIALTSLALCVFVAIQSLLLYRYWKEEFFTLKTGLIISLGLLVVFIGFNWSGFIVTLLWLLLAVIIFSVGLVKRWNPVRMAAIVLIGITLIKLLVLDSLRFTTIQKVTAYLVLGVLLLVVSFFYQKFREQLFSDNK